MDYLQYSEGVRTLETQQEVLNLVINGLPSIHIKNNKDTIIRNKMF